MPDASSPSLTQEFSEECQACRKATQKRSEALANALAQQTVRLTEARDQALAADKAKTEFLARMSHEIRTPINGLLGVSRILQEGDLSDEQNHLVEVISNCATSLLLMVEDLLDFSRIESGHMELRSEEFSLFELLTEVVELFYNQTVAKGVDLMKSISPEHCFVVRGDRMRLRQILTNLVSNALKFTDRGHVCVFADGRLEDGIFKAKLGVSDTGIGIPRDRQRAIFDVFTQADGTTSRRFGGTGLGLAISRDLVELMDGTISVQSELGKGSTFSCDIEFPIVSNISFGPVHLEGVETLVFWSESNRREFLSNFLLHWGSRVATSADPSVVFSWLSHCAPGSILILDQSDCETSDVLTEIVNRAVRQQCYVIAVSSGVTNSPVQISNFVQKLWKPISMKRLAELLSTRENWSGGEALSAISTSTPRYSGARVLIVEDNLVNALVTKHLLGRYGIDAQVASDGQQAVNMVTADSFDLILMDISMPEMDGYEATKLIRQIPGRERSAIIALTAHSLASEQKRYEEAKMSGFLSKPIQEQELEQAFEQHLAHRRRDERAA